MTSKIVGIQFSVLPPSDIRNGVAKITNRETYVSNQPKINGLFDTRMGVLDYGLTCPTDGLDYMQTPGYHGYLEIERPIFYIQYLSTVLKILKCVCFKCSKLLICKEKYKHALKMLPDARWKYVCGLCEKVKRCGDCHDDGCQSLVPIKIKKTDVATVWAEWKNTNDDDDDDDAAATGEKKNIVIKCTPEIVLKIFKRISDDDITFMGFSPKWSRPEWMICQVMIVPPPAVRPSVRNDSQQRSEDDLTHILVNIVKTNQTISDKIKNNVSENVIDDWVNVLTYYACTQINNKIPGVPPVIQRSGRPLKSIGERLNGKGGRIRGNLMAKRVDFSARTVIGAEPNISIRELGVPIRIAKNLTKPVVVNRRNYDFCMKLVQNGPENYPGAKTIVKKNGVTYNLRYLKRDTIKLDFGDIVHRHMMDGDPVLFNRQPSLHRMSMMCHLAKIMMVGDTFRLNVADTKPYNADFDGDEMNLHMPQDVESEVELKLLAAVPYQIISPANNSPIIGIFQDNMLGSYQFTRSDTHFSKKEAMNLLMSFNQINYDFTNPDKPTVSNFEILSQIMPPLSLHYKTKFFSDSENYATSNNVVDIQNGEFFRGQLDKSTLGGGSKSIIQRVCNDFGNMHAANFIDNLQNIVTEYMKTSSYSVGVSDLIADDKTNEKIVEILTEKKQEGKKILEQVHLGIFENNSGRTNEEAFEAKMDGVVKQASSETGRVGLKNLEQNNRFITMVNAGSKGSELNITQMISCVGQQNVDGKRIPYGFENRTLPHFTKYDDGLAARGFVESSYINGLSPSELFFHAMGGRIGLIDTAVKTSQTGYIQRRIIKGLEDLKVHYDMTVRGTKNVVIQFQYGEDGMDTVKVETQNYPILTMSIEEIYSHFNIPAGSLVSFKSYFEPNVYQAMEKNMVPYLELCKKYTDLLIDTRPQIIKNVFHSKISSSNSVQCPVAFYYIINNTANQLNLANEPIDLTLREAYEMIEKTYHNFELLHYSKPTLLFKVLYFYWMSPKYLLLIKRFTRSSLTVLLTKIMATYKKAIIAPGEMVGMIAAQSIGEVSTQMTLNTFHFAGVSSKSNVTRGVPRIEEILDLSASPKNPSLTIYLKPEDQTKKEKATAIMHQLEHTLLKDIVDTVEICFDPDNLNTLIKEDETTMRQYHQFQSMIAEVKAGGEGSGGGGGNSNDTRPYSKWIIRLTLDNRRMLDKNITMEDVNFTLNQNYKETIQCVYSDYNADKLVFRIRLASSNKGMSVKAAMLAALAEGTNNPDEPKQRKPLDQSDQIYILKNFQDQLLNNTILKGIKDLNHVIMRKIKDVVMNETDGIYTQQDVWVLDTVGTNLLEVLGLDYIDAYKTISNDIIEVYHTLGVEAARQTIYNELMEVIEFDGTYINSHHYSLLCDRMSYSNKLISTYRFGINQDNIGPIAKASFEETPKMLLEAARHGELDNMRGVSANVMCGQEGYYGTSSFQTLFDMHEFVALSREYAQAMIEKEKHDTIEEEKEAEEEKEDDDDMHDTLEEMAMGTQATQVKQKRKAEEEKARQAVAAINKKRNMLSIYTPGDPCDFKNISIPNPVDEVKPIQGMTLDNDYDIHL
jgi:DNA-directed RNA polymerase II subunit RPB1